MQCLISRLLEFSFSCNKYASLMVRTNFFYPKGGGNKNFHYLAVKPNINRKVLGDINVLWRIIEAEYPLNFWNILKMFFTIFFGRNK